MSSDRRPQLAQRRRRVIYAHGMEAAGGVSKAAAAARREARRPTAAYGSRVHRRLRARWFGLVPVRRRSLSLAIAVVTTVAAMLSLGHWAAIRWAPLAYAPNIARPLRLDRPDSFGTWLGTLLLFSAAGAAFLIYQLRRYRSDDYQGRYRIWRPVILLLAVACLDSVVGLVDWGGHLLDACLGERKALSGGDWIRLLLTIGGAALGLRMLAEVWKSRVATIALGVGALALAYPALVHWKILQVDSPLSSTFYSSAPLWTRAAIWVAMLAYLRLLYRDVRQIDANDRLADRMRNLKLVRLWTPATADEPTDPQEKPAKTAKRTAQAKPQPAPKRKAKVKPTERETQVDDENAGDDADQENQETRPKRRWFGLRKPASPPAEAADRDGDEAEIDDDDDDQENQETRPRRRWLGLRKPASPPADAAARDGDEAEIADDDDDQENQEKRGKRRWLGLRKPASQPADAADRDDDEAAHAGDDADQENQENRPKRRWLGLRKPASQSDDVGDRDEDEAEQESQENRPKRRWFGLRKTADSNNGDGDPQAADDQDEPAGRAEPTSRSAPSSRSAPPSRSDTTPSAAETDPSGDSDEELDPDSIDWSSLNKAERRRLRRELKRQGKAA